MRALTVLVLVLAALWGGYWFYGASRAEDAAHQWFADAPARGLAASHAGISVSGFPNRFDLTVTEPRVMDHHTGLDWRAPFVQVFALSYRPHHVIATWPNEQTVTLEGVPVDILTTRMQASAVFAPAAGLTLDRANFVAENLQLRGPDWTLSAAQAQLATRAGATRAGTWDVALDLADLSGSPLPQDASLSLIVDGTATLTEADVLEEVVLRNLSLRSGAAELAGDGRVTVAPDGQLSGRIDLRAREWREMLSLAVEMGLVAPGLEQTYANALALLASMSGDPQTVEAPLAFNRGIMTLGPLPLGPAPRIAF